MRDAKLDKPSTGLEFRWGERTYVMGILNVTPDSFSDGGRYLDPAAALAHARQMVADGADIIDVGGESTAPGAEPVPLEEELARVLPVIEALAAELPVPISVDTYKAEVARRAVAAGARIVNDVRALRGDPDMAAAVAETGAHVILLHHGEPRDGGDVTDMLLRDFEEMVARAERAGISREKIWLDPGFGFGKGAETNLALTRELAALRALGRPLVYGPSRKRTLGLVTGLPAAERDEATAGLAALAATQGADVVRVHNVRMTSRAVRMVDAVCRGWPAPLSDAIRLTGMRFVADHGAYPEERGAPQPFVVDVRLYGDWRRAAGSDDLAQAVDYAAVWREVAAVVEGPRHNLLESLAEAIAARLLARFPVSRAWVRVHKPRAPLGGPVNDVAVEVVRSRDR
ncbi:MAG: dihydropteroate synthase [Clostridia bacterium]|nr:dihydropteroate synthase [Clostridia bacterium]